MYAGTAIAAFISRTFFIQILGVQYLGISGLYSNILSMLALSDLGLNVVMLYSLYKPLAEHDTQKIAVLIRYYKKIYYIIASVVLALGLMCIPILPYVVKNSLLTPHELVVYYVLILLNSICSYLVVSKITLIRADQKAFIVQMVTTGCTVMMHVFQIVMLYYTGNYTAYLLIQIAFTLLSNLILSAIANRKYPYLKESTHLSIGKEQRREIVGNLKSTFLYKVGAVIMNSTDNILISVLLGTVVVGYYSNYLVIIAMVNNVIAILVQAVLASVGNYNATQNSESKYQLFRFMMMGFYALAGFCAACYICIFDDFIKLWIGEEFILPKEFLYALVVNSFVLCILNPLWMTRESAGVFKSIKYLMLCAAALNIGLSVLLGKTFGLGGIILATAIAQLLTIFWYEPKILCKKVFSTTLRKYWELVAKLLGTCIPIVVVGCLLQQWVSVNPLVMVLKISICALATVISFRVMFSGSDEMAKAESIISNLPIIKKII